MLNRGGPGSHPFAQAHPALRAPLPTGRGEGQPLSSHQTRKALPLDGGGLGGGDPSGLCRPSIHGRTAPNRTMVMSAFGEGLWPYERLGLGRKAKVSLLRMMLGFSTGNADPGMPVPLVYRIRRIRKICLVEKAERNCDQVWPTINNIHHGRPAVRAKPVSDLASTVSGPNKLEPIPLNSDSVDRKADLCRKGAPRPLLAGPAVTDGKSEGLARAIRSKATATTRGDAYHFVS